VDETGICGSPEECRIAWDCEIEDVQGRGRLQGFDPVGVGARERLNA